VLSMVDDADDFKQQLLAAARERDLSTNPFVRGVHKGSYSRGSFCRYASELARLTSGFPRRLAAILARCEVFEVRRSLLANLMEEEGVVSFSAEGGLVADRSRSHAVFAWRFARAAGATPEESSCLETGSRWFDQQIAEGRWIGPLAYLTLGYELNAPLAGRMLAEGFRAHYGFAEDDLAYFTMHCEADERHSAEGAAMIARVANTPATRHEALEGARRGASAFWHFHRRHHRVLMGEELLGEAKDREQGHVGVF
ncbi:MAG: TenA family transcriptional regulator, partial [Pyrinomonadaceae bacterium]